jgi:hypothetical protein
MELTGSQFGHWLVLGLDGRKYGAPAYLCRCVCGVERRVGGGSLRSGGSTNCGCQHRISTGNRARTHGMHAHPIHGVWRSMKERCENPNHVHFGRYGGRGISVCAEWRDFAAFNSDMGGDWKPGLKLDRIDNDGSYHSGNCRWVTAKVQANNRSNTRFLEFSGERLPLATWADRLGISQNSLRSRLNNGWSVDEALSMGPQKAGRRGARMTLNFPAS